MHWCNDENLAVLSTLPFVGYYFRRLHIWYHSKFKTSCHTESCCSTPTAPVEESWDVISISEAEERFGQDMIDDLLGDLQLLETVDTPRDEEFIFWVNQDGEIKVSFRGKEYYRMYGSWRQE